MYRKIEKLPSVAAQYSERLVGEKLLTAAEAQAVRKKVSDRLNAAFDANKAAGKWVLQPALKHTRPNSTTAISRELLERVVAGITYLPETFHLHPKLDGVIRKRRQGLRSQG